MRTALLFFATICCLACAPPLRPPPSDGGSADGGAPALPVTLLETWDGGARARLDATNGDVWLLLDLETSSPVADPDGPWDLGASRFHLKSNSGISGDGGVEVAPVLSAFETVTSIPDGGFLIDRVDGDDEGVLPDLVFLSPEPWFGYDPRYHTLSPRPVTYVVRTVERHFYKVAVEGFYDSAGTSGFVTLRWSRLETP